MEMNEAKEQPNMTCQELQELVPAYVLGSLSADEQELMEANMANCPDVLAEIASYDDLTDSMFYRVPAVDPSPDLKNKILANILTSDDKELPRIDTPAQSLIDETEKTNTIAPVAEDTKQISTVHTPDNVVRVPSRLWQLVAAAAVLALIFTNAFWLQRSSQAPTTLIQDELVAFIGSGPAQAVQMTADDRESNASLAWVKNIEGDTWLAWFAANEMPVLESNQQYELILSREGEEPIVISLFIVDETGTSRIGFEISEPIGSFDRVEIRVKDETTNEVEPFLGAAIET